MLNQGIMDAGPILDQGAMVLGPILDQDLSKGIVFKGQRKHWSNIGLSSSEYQSNIGMNIKHSSEPWSNIGPRFSLNIATLAKKCKFYLGPR